MANGDNVPGLDNTPQFSENVPGVSFPLRGATMPGEMIAHGGQGIERGAEDFADIADKVQQGHDIATAQSNTLDASVSFNQLQNKLKLASPDGFYRDPQTNEIVKNPDGSQRTVAQESWDQMNAEYMARQQSMTSRGAAIFRQQMLPEISRSTQALQGWTLEKQADNTKQLLTQQNQTRSNDLLANPYIDGGETYVDINPDGSHNVRPSQQKFIQQAQEQALATQRQSALNPLQTREIIASQQADLAEHSAEGTFNDIMESDPGKKFGRAIPQTALIGLHNMRDMIEGKDPESITKQSKGLPTWHTSMTPEQQNRWIEKIDAFKDQAVTIDKHDMDLQMRLIENKAQAGGYLNTGHQQGLDAFWAAPEVQHVMGMGAAQNVSPAEIEEKLLPSMQATFKNGLPKGIDGLPLNKQMNVISARTQASMKSFEQSGQMQNLPYFQGMGKSLINNATNGVISDVKKQDEEFHKDPAGFFLQPSSTQDLANGLSYRDNRIKNATDQLNRDPSVFGLMKPDATGKPILQTLAERQTKNQIAKGGFGFDPQFFDKDTASNLAGLIKETAKNQPGQVDNLFESMRTNPGTKQYAMAAIHQLVQNGGLPVQFEQAQLLQDASARRNLYSQGALGDLGMGMGGKDAPKSQEMRDWFYQDFKAPLSTRASIYGQSSGQFLQFSKNLQDAYISQVSRLMSAAGGGLSADDARAQAKATTSSGMGATLQTAEPAFKLSSPSTWLHSAQTPIVPFRPNYTPREQSNISSRLAQASTPEALKAAGITVDPRDIAKQNAFDFTNKLTPEWAAHNTATWYAEPVGNQVVYRLKIKGMNANGNPTGDTFTVKYRDNKGQLRNYEIPESTLRQDPLPEAPGPVPTPGK